MAPLMELPGSTKQASKAPPPYTYAHNPWRGSSVAPMATHIRWDLYRDGNTYLVRMLCNEEQTAFKPDCVPVSKGSYFYEVDELKRCFERTVP